MKKDKEIEESNHDLLANKDIANANLALEQIIKYLTKTPVLFIIGFLIICAIVSTVFVIKLLIDSRDREQRLNDRMIQVITEKSPQIIERQLAPTLRKVENVVNRVDSTTLRVDSLVINSVQ